MLEQKQEEGKKKLIGGILSAVITRKSGIDTRLSEEIKKWRNEGYDYQTIRRILIYKNYDIVDVEDAIDYMTKKDKEEGIKFD